MKFWQVDSFTDTPYSGNPAAVIVLVKDISAELKQKIAREMCLPETAFVLLESEEPSIRWFSPIAEVALCGHATLAAAHILWSEGIIREKKITFTSMSGPLTVYKGQGEYTLDFPRQEPRLKEKDKILIVEILGVDPLYIGSNGQDCMAEVEAASIVRSIDPNLDYISALDERSLIVTSRDDSGKYDYIYRAFFPKLGIPEDPVTGSANTMLAPYWGAMLGKKNLSAYQASARGGELALRLEKDRVFITGKACTVIKGILLPSEAP